MTLRQAAAFIAQHHRHNKPPRGHKFSVGVYDGARLVGVATAGRPVSRHLDDGLTIEVNRSCTTDTSHRLSNGHVDGANSMLYAATWRAAKAMGYRRWTTYTQADESGASLRAIGARPVEYLEPRGDWHKARVAQDDLFGMPSTAGVARVRWEIARA